MNRFKSWWKEGIIYQVYPRSFQDGNHDGTGDLQGIIDRLDYLQWLGIVAVWLSPVFESPMRDFGYDVSDYRKIADIFGSQETMEALIQAAHGRGIRILLDMVINHTSSEHAWFLESATGTDSPKRDFYIWHDGLNRKAPNNWKAAFGGSAWEFERASGQYYLHSFLREQPDLNWRNPDVEQAVFDDMKYWFERGVDGFRLDVINLIVKDGQYRNNPCHKGATIRPYDMQRHLYDRDQPEAHHVLKRMRQMTDRYDQRMLVGEIMVDKPGDPVLAASYQGEEADELHLAFDFSFTYAPWDASRFRKLAQAWYDAAGTHRWPCWVLSNHDVVRAFSRFGNNQDRARLSALFLLTQKGTPFIYYGEEIGMRDLPVAPWNIHDPVGKRYWPFHPGRDGQRRPMQWGSSSQWSFSTQKPWLPYHPSWKQSTVESQKGDPNSLLTMYRNLIALRNHDDALRMGEIRFIDHDIPDVLAYVREHAALVRLVLLNFSFKEREIPSHVIVKGLGDPAFRVLFSTTGKPVREDNTALVLEGCQGLLLCEGE